MDQEERLRPALADRYRIERISVAAQGEDRSLAVLENPDSPSTEIHVITNWFQVLKEREGG